jgi:hypothetical protein
VIQVEFRVGPTDARPVLQQQLRVYAAQMHALHIRAETLSQRVALNLALGGDFGSDNAAGAALGSLPVAPDAATPPRVTLGRVDGTERNTGAGAKSLPAHGESPRRPGAGKLAAERKSPRKRS